MAVSVILRTENKLFRRWSWLVMFGEDDIVIGHAFTHNGAVIKVGDELNARGFEAVDHDR